MSRKKIIICAWLFTSIVLSKYLLAQDSTELEEIYKRSHQTSVAQDTSQTNHYATPEIYNPDSIQGKSQPYNENKSGDSDTSIHEFEMAGVYKASQIAEGEQMIPKPGPSDLKLFGENLFGSATSDFSPAPIATVPSDYTLGPGDNLIVNLWGQVDLELNLTIDREGKVFIPKAGEIKAFGLTLDKFKEVLRRKLETVFSGFELGVMLGKIRTIRVYIYGEVKRPGGYTISALSTFFNALYYSGGPSINGSMRDVRLIRGEKQIASVDLYQFLLQGNTSGNFKLESEDVIFVPIVGPLVAARGEVKRPAIYELKGSERLLDVIQLAGGVAEEAYLGRVMIDRINAGEDRKLLDLSLATPGDKERNNFVVQGGDDISVFSIYEKRQNVVWLGGHVKHPGAYQLEERPTITRLLDSGRQLREEAYLQRADLIRTYADTRQELIPINLEQALNGNAAQDLQLRPNDSLNIYPSWAVIKPRFVSIAGEVQNPGEYRLFQKMKLSDLVFLSGNLKRGAYTLTAEIARRHPGAELELIYIDLEKVIAGEGVSEDPFLQEDDYVFIRRIPKWDLDRFVTVAGEVRFPGKYALFKSNETVYDLIQRAGGLTDEAFPTGTILIRPETEQMLRRINLKGMIERANPYTFDSAGELSQPQMIQYNPQELSRVVIDMDLILGTKGAQGNPIVQKGDSLYIPPEPAGVQVAGAVGSSGTINFIPGRGPGFYIDRAGGYLPHADKSQLRVVRANGQILSGAKARRHAMGLGDIVVIPSKIKRDKNIGQSLLTSFSIISSIITTVYIIEKL